MYTYQLNSKIAKIECPNCQSKRHFVLYTDSSNTPLHPTVGRCDNAIKCGHHYKPKQYFAANGIEAPKQAQAPKAIIAEPPTYLSKVQLAQTLMPDADIRYIATKNNFIKYLLSIFNEKIVSQLIATYYIGTSKHSFKHNHQIMNTSGANIFWQVDADSNVRYGKIMLYNPTTGKRIKQPIDAIASTHPKSKHPTYNLIQCLFGEHLIQGNAKPIAIVESEKTAIICSVLYPTFIWLASGQIGGLNRIKCKAIQNRNVVLFPDFKGYDKWILQAQKLGIANIKVSNLLEIKGIEYAVANSIDIKDMIGFDLADLLIMHTNTPEPITPHQIAATPPPPTNYNLPIALSKIIKWYATAPKLPKYIYLNNEILYNPSNYINMQIQLINAHLHNPQIVQSNINYLQSLIQAITTNN